MHVIVRIMQIFNLNSNWSYCSFAANNNTVLPESVEQVDMPLDFLILEPRDFLVQSGSENSYYPERTVTIFRELPPLEKSSKIILEFSGVCGIADVYLGNNLITTIADYAPMYADITSYYNYGSANILKLIITAPSATGKYTGLGIAGGVKLLAAKEPLYIIPEGINVVAQSVTDGAFLKIRADVNNLTDEKKIVFLEMIIFNAKGKRICRRLRRVRLGAGSETAYEFNIRLRRFYEYNSSDPYLYSCQINLLNKTATAETKEIVYEKLGGASQTFGIRCTALSSRGLLLNGKSIKVAGAVMFHDNGLIGAMSVQESEYFKLNRIKELGYNAVRYTICPTDAVLNTLDKLGLIAMVDLFDVWTQGARTFDGHINFQGRLADIAKNSILKLRCHPSVVFYGMGDRAAEINTPIGEDLAREIAQIINEYDSSRPIVANVTGNSKEYFAGAAVAGYKFALERYEGDRDDGRLILGTATLPSESFVSMEEAEKYSFVIGDFKFAGADFLGSPLGEPLLNEKIDEQEIASVAEDLDGELSEDVEEYFDDEDTEQYLDEEEPFIEPAHASFCGDLDINYAYKPQAYYRQILNGDRSVSLITVTNPDKAYDGNTDKFYFEQGEQVWNWPQHIGKQLEVQVMTGGEVVALYLDGKICGRKLAGKMNNQIASFKVDYYPGKLEAICYHRGVECSRSVLETVSSPRALKITGKRRNIKVGELCFLEIALFDKENRRIFNNDSEIHVEVTGDADLFVLGNANNYDSSVALNYDCMLYGGKALCVVRGMSEGKAIVKVTGMGLLSGKTTVKIKP